MKKRLIFLLPLILLITLLSLYFRPIGDIRGPEWDTVVIDGVEYRKVSGAPSEYDIYSFSDRGNHLGIIVSGDTLLHVYSVKGDPQRNYLYIRWEWEGEIYIRTDFLTPE